MAQQINVSPTVMNFTYQIGSTFPPPQLLTITSSVPMYLAEGESIAEDGACGWLTTNQGGYISGNIPMTESISEHPFSGGMCSLQPGTYRGDIAIYGRRDSDNYGCCTAWVNVTLTVIAATPQATPVSFTYQSGGAAPPAQYWNISSDSYPLNMTLSTSGQQWLVASLSSPTTPTVLTISVNPLGMAAGNYTGTVFARSSQTSQQNTLEFDIALTVLPPLPPPTLAVSPSLLNFSVQYNSNDWPASQTVSVTSTKGPTLFTVDTTSCLMTVGILITSQASGTTLTSGGYLVTPATLSIGMMPVSFAVGTYNCSVAITDTSNLNNSAKLSIVLAVTAIPPITATPSTLTFNAVQGSSATLPLLLQAGTSSSGIAVFLDTTSPMPSWLSLSGFNGSAQTPVSLSVVANSGGLAPGNYSGSIKFYALMPPPQATSYVTVNVTLTVQTIPVVTATSTQLSFEYQIGGAIPNAQTIQVTASANGAAFSTSTTTTSGGNWLSLNVTSGTAPATLYVSVIPTSLLPGSYQGTVTINGVNGAAGSTVVPVKLTVGAALPTITSVVNAASFLKGNVAPGELVSVFGTAMGPSTQLQTQLDSTGNVATTLGGVQVLFNGTPAPLTYVSAGQINCAVPYEVYILGSPYSVWVKYLGQTSNAFTVSPATVAPGIFATNGTGQGAVLNQNGSANGPKNPEVAGNIISVFMTGEGQTSPLGITGSITCKNGCATLQQIPAPLLAPNALVNNQPATVVFYGEAPSMMAGLLQVNLVIPPNTPSGLATLAISLGGISSQTGVTFMVASGVN